MCQHVSSALPKGLGSSVLTAISAGSYFFSYIPLLTDWSVYLYYMITTKYKDAEELEQDPTISRLN